MDEDYALALQLQSELFENNDDSGAMVSERGKEPVSLVDPYWEMTDPNPDIRSLFLQFNEKYFWGRLSGIEVKWSPRMTLCAGLCCYEGRGGLCSVRLSVPLLQLRPRKDLVETLLHEMIHAYLFVTDNNKDHDGHGPEFHKHMYRLNKETGTSISVYHNFHDEVAACRQHWWRCDGPCRSRKPYFGYVKRSMNRAPSKNDTWWNEHQRTCGGTYTKVKEPEGFGKKKSKTKNKDDKSKNNKDVQSKSPVKSMDIRIFGGTGKTLGAPNKTSATNTKPLNGPAKSTPTSTVTSSIHEKNNRLSGKDVPPLPTLSGATTPGRSSGAKNKPVSQGGSATMGKKQVLIFDFSDSEDSDDDILGSMPLDNACTDTAPEESHHNNKVPELNEDSEADCIELPECSGNIVDGTTKQEIHSQTGDTVQDSDVDSNDVRAMLRKVWGAKQLNNGKIKTKSVKRQSDEILAGSGSTGAGNQPYKRPKVSDFEGCDTRSFGSQDSNKSLRNEDFRKTNIQSASAGTSKVTSPIEKMFNKIKAKETGDTSTNSGVRERTPNDSSEELSSCPICCKDVPVATINDHLDLCLTLQAIS